MESVPAPASAAEGRGRKWIVAAAFGGLMLAYAAYAFAFYKIVVTIF
jgi:uncharacterized membrane protein YqhA